MAEERSIDASLIRELAEILSENGLAEIDIKTEDARVRLSAPVAFAGTPAPIVAPSAPPVAAAPAVETRTSGEPAASAAPMTGDLVPSPVVGTAYLSPSPGADPFIREGQQVREGDTLLIIEAMKVMNQIPAPRSGKVVEIMCENGQPVEFDQPLLVIE